MATHLRMTQRRWRAVCFAGLVGGDGMALISHELEQEQPAVTMSPVDAADLGQCHRGVGPLRIVVMPQRDRQIASP